MLIVQIYAWLLKSAQWGLFPYFRIKLSGYSSNSPDNS